MSADKNNELFNPASIRDLATAFQQSRILLTAYELNLFTFIDGHLLTADAIAEKVGASADGISRILNALTAIGLVRKTHDKYFNSEEASRYLVKGKPEYMSGLMHTNNLWKTWSTLTEAVIRGKSVADPDRKAKENTLDSFISAMHYRAVPQSKIISLLIDFTGVKRILDLGGGSAAFAMTFLKNNPDAHATLFDVPGVVELAKDYVEKESLTSRFSFIPGNYLTDNYGSGYDLIFASAIVHINSFLENKELVQKCYNSLNPGGQIVISDFVMNDDRTQPKAGTIFAINMLVGTSSGNTYTEKEINSWLYDAGFVKPERKETSFGSTLIIGRKP
jgi:ubiquinone/menaquinone biosynthesis C-methylase UbiE/predicted transcriptional regulator